MRASQGQHLSPRAVTHGPRHHFVGFYDVCPWSPSGRYLLGMESTFTDHLPDGNETAGIGVVDLEGGDGYRVLAKTSAWNFQQGARLQWIPSMRGDVLVYNDRDADRFVAKTLEVGSGSQRTLPLPVYALSNSGDFTVTTDFARLNRLYGGYGYAGLPDHTAHEYAPNSEGVRRMDLATGEHQLILSTAEAVRFGDLSEEERQTDHYLTHMLVSPDDLRFAFFHRWRLRDGGIHTRLLTASVDGTNLRLVTEGNVTHFCWKSPTEILVWARPRSILTWTRRKNVLTWPVVSSVIAQLRKIRRGTIRHKLAGDRYQLFDETTGEAQPVAVGTLTRDGHPTFSPDGRWLVTDTYQNTENSQTLILFDWKRDCRLDLATLPSPPDLVDTPWRCDLHPRWNRRGTEICVDSAHDGTRQIYIVDVSEIVGE